VPGGRVTRPGCIPLSQNLEGPAENVLSFENPCAPPMRLIGLQSIVCRLDPRDIELPVARAPVRFRFRATFPRTDRPPPLAKRVHSLVSASPLRSYFACPPGLSFRSDLSCQGFVPLRGMTRRCPLGAGALRLPLRSVLRFSQPLDGLRHLPASRAYCIPQPRPGFPVQGLLPFHRRTDSSPARASLPFPSTRSLASQLPREGGPTSRLCSVDRCVPKGR